MENNNTFKGKLVVQEMNMITLEKQYYRIKIIHEMKSNTARYEILFNFTLYLNSNNFRSELPAL